MPDRNRAASISLDRDVSADPHLADAQRKIKEIPAAEALTLRMEDDDDYEARC